MDGDGVVRKPAGKGVHWLDPYVASGFLRVFSVLYKLGGEVRQGVPGTSEAERRMRPRDLYLEPPHSLNLRPRPVLDQYPLRRGVP